MRRLRRLIPLALAPVVALGLGLVAGTADAAPSKAYTVTRTVGPYNGAAKPGDGGTVPQNGEAKTVACNPGDSILSGSATVTRKTSHGTAKNTVLTVDVVGAFWNTEVERLQYGAFVGTTGKAGWNSVVLTVSCRRNI